MVRVRDIDWASGDGAGLIASLVGTGLEAVVPLVDKAFLMAVPSLPGGRFVGAVLRRPDGDDEPIGVIGGGTQVVPALIACLGEAAERWSLVAAGYAHSAGVAAGPTEDEAFSRALLEAVERHALALWWAGDQPAAVVAVDDRALGEAFALLAELRGNQTDRRTWLLDISAIPGLPVIVAVSVERNGFGCTIGAAARGTVAGAAVAAVVELAQMELGLAWARWKAEKLGEVGLSPDDRRHLARASQIDASLSPPLRPSALPRHRVHGGESVPPPHALIDTLATHGLRASREDLTHPTLAIPVMRAKIADLRSYPHDFTPPSNERLNPFAKLRIL